MCVLQYRERKRERYAALTPEEKKARQRPEYMREVSDGGIVEGVIDCVV